MSEGNCPSDAVHESTDVRENVHLGKHNSSETSDGDETSAKRDRKLRKIRIAVAGCSHGEMDKIYATIAEIERRRDFKIDLLISCGDYQAVRNCGDLCHMKVPEKYRSLQTFYRYYSGEAVAPVLTIFVGGNHEASGFLQELPYGGWVAPRIFYMGHASVVQFAGLRIAGLSGIYKATDYDTGHWERPPFDDQRALVSVYHVRSVDVFRLKQLKAQDASRGERLDIMVSHDWPCGITDFGDVQGLLRVKSHFEDDINKSVLGNPATMSLLNLLRPAHWFAAHLHCKFAALVTHPKGDDEENEPVPTRFLSLDKPLPGRHFLQIVEYEVSDDADLNLGYDPTWLAILRLTDSFTNVSKGKAYLPSQASSAERWDFRPTAEDIEQVKMLFGGDFRIPENFRTTARPQENQTPRNSEVYYRNPQTAELCAKLGIRNLNEMLCALSPDSVGIAHYLCSGDGELVPTQEEFREDDNFIIDRGDGRGNGNGVSDALFESRDDVSSGDVSSAPPS